MKCFEVGNTYKTLNESRHECLCVRVTKCYAFFRYVGYNPHWSPRGGYRARLKIVDGEYFAIGLINGSLAAGHPEGGASGIDFDKVYKAPFIKG